MSKRVQAGMAARAALDRRPMKLPRTRARQWIYRNLTPWRIHA